MDKEKRELELNMTFIKKVIMIKFSTIKPCMLNVNKKFTYFYR